MMDLSVASTSPIDVPRQAYQTAMEDLAKLLQGTKNSVEGIISRYNSSGPTFKVSELSTCLSIARNCSGGGFQPQNGTGKSLHDPRAVQDWFTQAQIHLERAGSGLPAPSPDPHTFSKVDDGAEDHALQVFLKEIRKTVLDWSERHKGLHQQKKPSTGNATHGGDLGGTNSGSLHVEGKEVQASGSSTFQGQGTTNLSLEGDLDKVVDGIASQRHPSDGEKPSSNHLDQPTCPFDVPSMEEEATQIPSSADEQSTIQTARVPVPDAKIEQIPLQSDAQAAVMQKEAKVTNPLVSSETTATAQGCVTPGKTDGAMANLPLAIWKPSAGTAKSEKTTSHRCPVEVIGSPDWLPEGWITELKTRSYGNSAGTKDKYFYDPVSKRRFRSKKEVFAFLERGRPKPKDNPEASPVKKLEFLSSAKKSNKKAKVMESSMRSAPALPSATGLSIPPPGGIPSNMFMPPFRPGQPSEWLVYESLASLPFPMFDPFYYTDNGAGKSSGSKGPHMPMRPWFFSGPETSRTPFTDRAGLGKLGDNGRDYRSFYPMPLFNPEVAPKSSASKNPIKRKPVGPP